MTLDNAQKAGIAVAILIVVCTVTASLFLYCTHSGRRHVRVDVEQPSRREDDDSSQRDYPRLPGPLNDNERRANPRTFYDWVRFDKGASRSAISKPVKGHAHNPSLEHGPGPVLVSSTANRHHTVPAAVTPKVERPGTSSSNRASSLRDAVLDVVSTDKNKETKPVKNKSKTEARPSGYTGAWP